jgi:hypothetical protein
LEEYIDSDQYRAMANIGNESQAPLVIKQISKIMSAYRRQAKRELYEVSPQYRRAVDKELRQKQQVQSQSFNNLLQLRN